MTHDPESKLRLDGGLEVEIFEIRCRPTLADVVLGSGHCLEIAALFPAWHMKPFVIHPGLRALQIAVFAEDMLLDELPHWRIDVWLRNLFSPSEMEMDRAEALGSELTVGSEMAVRFFRNHLSGRLIDGVVLETIRSLDWHQLAQAITLSKDDLPFGRPP